MFDLILTVLGVVALILVLDEKIWLSVHRKVRQAVKKITGK